MNKLHFWIGHFDTPELFTDYLEENDDADADAVPLNKFCMDQNETWVDHDLMEMFYGEETADLRDIFNDGNYVDSFKDKIYDEYKKTKNSRPMNCYITVYEYDAVEKPKSVKGNGYWLKYLGSFEYKKTPD